MFSVKEVGATMTRLSASFGRTVRTLAALRRYPARDGRGGRADIVLRNTARSFLGERDHRIRAYLITLLTAAVAAAARPACEHRHGSFSCRGGCLDMEAAARTSSGRGSLVLIWYGSVMTVQSARLGSLTIKNLVFPEWWLLAPLPVCFALLALEFVFRFHRLMGAPRTRRIEATSVG